MPKPDKDVKETATETAEEESSTTEQAEEELESQDEEQEVEGDESESSTEDVKESEGDESDEEEEEASAPEHEDKVPYDRFKEVNQSLKETREELRSLKEQLNKPAKTGDKWEDLDDAEIRRVRRHFMAQSDWDMVDKADEEISRRREKKRDDRLQNQQAFKQRQFDSFQSTVQEYKQMNDPDFDLSNPKSALYTRTDEMVKSDERFSVEPEGFSIAAHMVASQMLRERMLKTKTSTSKLRKKVAKANAQETLDTANAAPTTPGAKQQLEKLEEAALASGNPFGPEWRQFLKAQGDAGKQPKEVR